MNWKIVISLQSLAKQTLAKQKLPANDSDTHSFSRGHLNLPFNSAIS